jgi:pimeloyl-ACP methyl ester carboxylesterase
MRRAFRPVLRGVALVSVAYAVACGGVAAFYRPFLYPAPSEPDPPLPKDATRIEATSRDGAKTVAFRFGPPAAEHPPLTIVYFHGNGQLAEDGFDLARSLSSHGWAVVLPEYRGYGVARSLGKPSEQALYDDAEAIVDSLDTTNDRVALMGYSLGTGVSVEMAARGHGRALVLLAPYTSIPDVASRRLPFLPMHTLMGDKLDSESKAAKVSLPVLVAHGDRDEIVPFDMGEKLAHTFPHGRFVTVSGGHHMDLFSVDDHLLQKIVDFLIEQTP